MGIDCDNMRRNQDRDYVVLDNQTVRIRLRYALPHMLIVASDVWLDSAFTAQDCNDSQITPTTSVASIEKIPLAMKGKR